MSKSEIVESVLAGILAEFNLGEFRTFEPFRSGTVQTNLLLETTRGRFVFRHYQNRSPGSVQFECNLIRYLKDRQYPCPGIYRNKHGKYVGMFDGKPFVIFEFIEGMHAEHPTDEQRRQLIQKAAELHILTRNYRPVYKNYRWNYGVDLCRELARQEAALLDTNSAREKLAWFEIELSNLRLPTSLPKGICHCDFHFSNVLFQGDEFKALIDFDDANYTYLTFDLVGLIESAAWRHDQEEELVFERAREVIDEYTRHRRLNPNEKWHLFDVFKLGILFDCIWYFGRGEGQDFYEKRKIDFLNGVGRDKFYRLLFGP